MKHAILMWVVLPLALLLFVQLTTPLIEHYGGWDNDGVYYKAMIKQFRGHGAGDLDIGDRDPGIGDPHAGLNVPAPWSRRVLTPFLASRLPFSPLTSVRILAFLSNWLSLVLMFAIARRAGAGDRGALLAVLFYAGVFWAIKFSVYSPGYVDYQTQAILLLGLFLIVSKRYGFLPPVIAVGVLQKESLLLLSLLAYIDYARHARYGEAEPDRGRGSRRLLGTRRSLAYLAALVVLPAACLVAVRVAIPSDAPPLAVTYFWNVVKAGSPAKWPRFLLAIFSGLGVLPLVLVYGGRSAVRYLRHRPLWLLLMGAGVLMLFGGIDKSRYFLYMLPAIVLVAVHIVGRAIGGVGRGGVLGGSTRDVPGLDRISVRAGVWLVVTLGVHYYLGGFFGSMGTFEDYLNRMVPVHATRSLAPEMLRLAIVSVAWIAVTVYTVKWPQVGRLFSQSRSRR